MLEIFTTVKDQEEGMDLTDKEHPESVEYTHAKMEKRIEDYRFLPSSGWFIIL